MNLQLTYCSIAICLIEVIIIAPYSLKHLVIYLNKSGIAIWCVMCV